MEPPQPPTTFTGRTVSWYEILEWQQDNRFILNGYRRETADYRAIMTGLTFLHNETCNVYTHFLGALLLPIIAVIVMCVLHLQLRFSGVSGADYAIFAIFFCCAETRKIAESIIINLHEFLNRAPNGMAPTPPNVVSTGDAPRRDASVNPNSLNSTQRAITRDSIPVRTRPFTGSSSPVRQQSIRPSAEKRKQLLNTNPFAPLATEDQGVDDPFADAEF
ncbi:hypothetical protein MY4038_009916 [Beauveria bassiana]